MKKYTSVFELESELIANGYTKDADIFIPADYEPNTLTDEQGNMIYYYNAYKTYSIVLN
jgi:hypothetical protein